MTRSGWKTGVVVLFVSFAVFILVLVAFASVQRFHLVEKDYYQKELRFQDKIDKLIMTRQNPDGITLIYDNNAGHLTVSFKPDIQPADFSGAITFFRPSDPALDRIEPVDPDENGIQIIDTANLRTGLWKVKVDWTVNGDEYYFEDVLIIE